MECRRPTPAWLAAKAGGCVIRACRMRCKALAHVGALRVTNDAARATPFAVDLDAIHADLVRGSGYRHALPPSTTRPRDGGAAAPDTPHAILDPLRHP